MKILYVIHILNPKSGGPVAQVSSISQKLAERGHEVTILTTDFLFDQEYARKIKNVEVIPVRSVFSIGGFIYSPEIASFLSTRIKDFDIIHLTHFLEEKKAIIFTRGHAQDDRSSNTAHSTRIIELGSNLLEDVNDILPVVDILITDYSSIFFDYLLCNKPCIFIPYDREEYERSVGFLFDDYNYWTPGKKVHDYLEFIEAIGEILSGKDTFKDRREELRDLFHYYQKSNTSENIIRFLNEYIYGENR